MVGKMCSYFLFLLTLIFRFFWVSSNKNTYDLFKKTSGNLEHGYKILNKGTGKTYQWLHDW